MALVLTKQTMNVSELFPWLNRGDPSILILALSRDVSEHWILRLEITFVAVEALRSIWVGSAKPWSKKIIGSGICRIIRLF